jgi:FlaA1/EpsC-like NDP-sugar epimerase
MILKMQAIARRANSRHARTIVVLGMYSTTLVAALWTAFLLRFEFSVPEAQLRILRSTALWFIPIKLIVLLGIGQFSGLLSFFSIPDLRRLFLGLLGPAAAIAIAWHCGAAEHLPPRSVIAADLCLSFLGLSAIRLMLRTAREGCNRPDNATRAPEQRIAIIGAGHVGAALAKELLGKSGLGMRPVAFFDDAPAKWGSRVHHIPIVGPPENIFTERQNLRIQKVVIAMPSAPAKRIREIIQILQAARITFSTVPSMEQIAAGKLVSQLREVDIKDLLKRTPVQLNKNNIRQYLCGKVVMVTGAGGSIGQELSTQIAEFAPQQLLLLEQSEVQLFQIEQALIEKGFGNVIRALIADILDVPRMRQIFAEFHPAVVFHAAAHKHVPMMEYQPTEALKNNTLASARLADLALEFHVERFVFVSTDKAINPTNVMGASKRLAELYIQSLQRQHPHETRFMAVRFGNVLGSSGSVIPVFKHQIRAGGPVKVTHPDVMRFFLTIPEAVGLVLQSGAQGTGGEIFVLDMGEPIKIADLARMMIELSGLRPGQDIEIQFVGLRPGEKLFEEVRHDSENMVATIHPKILSFVSEPVPFYEISQFLDDLEQSLPTCSANRLKLLIKEQVPEYTPELASPGKAKEPAYTSDLGRTRAPLQNQLA